MSYSKGITVNYNPQHCYSLDDDKPWEVLDDGLCYCRYATEEEAKSSAATLVGQNDLALRLELDLNELIDNFGKVHNLTYYQVRNMIKEQLVF
jgi:hypothetical protein